MNVKLSVFKRQGNKKSEAKQIRREGNVPGVVYSADGAPQNISVSGEELRAILRGMDSGQLATAVFEIEVDGKRERAIVKDIQYHVATYAIEHIDLMILGDKKVRVNVPIQLAGVSDCAGVKLGGFLRQVVRAMRVECPAGEIPQAFTLDVKELQVSQSRRLADIAIPQGVRPLVPLNEVAVVVAKPKGA